MATALKYTIMALQASRPRCSSVPLTTLLGLPCLITFLTLSAMMMASYSMTASDTAAGSATATATSSTTSTSAVTIVPGAATRMDAMGMMGGLAALLVLLHWYCNVGGLGCTQPVE